MAYNTSTRTLDHFTFRVPEDQFDTIVSWYLAALAPIGYGKQAEFPGVVGIGTIERADFWIASKEDAHKTSEFHLGFRAEGRQSHAAPHRLRVEAQQQCVSVTDERCK